MDGLMKRSLRLFIIVGVLLLLGGAALYSTCAALGHSMPVAQSSSHESTAPWSSGDAATADLLILSIAFAFCGWVTVLLIARWHRRHSMVDRPFCRHQIRMDDRACGHCGSRFA